LTDTQQQQEVDANLYSHVIFMNKQVVSQQTGGNSTTGEKFYNRWKPKSPLSFKANILFYFLSNSQSLLPCQPSSTSKLAKLDKYQTYHSHPIYNISQASDLQWTGDNANAKYHQLVKEIFPLNIVSINETLPIDDEVLYKLPFYQYHGLNILHSNHLITYIYQYSPITGHFSLKKDTYLYFTSQLDKVLMAYESLETVPQQLKQTALHKKIVDIYTTILYQTMK
jgi:hypothetical protein